MLGLRISALGFQLLLRFPERLEVRLQFDQDDVLHGTKMVTYGLFLRGHGPPTICSCDYSPNYIPFLWGCLVDEGLSLWTVTEFVRKSREIQNEICLDNTRENKNILEKRGYRNRTFPCRVELGFSLRFTNCVELLQVG